MRQGFAEKLIEILSARPTLGNQECAQELHNLGACAYSQYQRTGGIEHIDKAIECWGRAATITPEPDEAMHALLVNLGCMYRLRFECLGELSDLSRAIECGMEAVSLIPDGYPGKPGALNNLGTSYETRFDRFGEIPDIDKAIDCHLRAILLTSDVDPAKCGRLSNLGNSYESRFRRLGAISDIDQAIYFKAQAVSLSPEGHPDGPSCLGNLGISYQVRFERFGKLSDINEAIACTTKAILLSPDGDISKPGYLNNLGISCERRFGRLGQLSDLNESIGYIARAISITPDGHPNKPRYFNNLGSTYRARFRQLGELSDIDEAISSTLHAVLLTPTGHPDRPAYLSNLGTLHEHRFGRLGDLRDLNEAISYATQAISLTPDSHPNRPGTLSNLGSSYRTRFERLSEISDLHKAIECQAQAIFLTPEGHPSKPGMLNNLGNSYRLKFDQLAQHSDLNEAIECQEKAVLVTPNDHPYRSTYLENLGVSYQTRFEESKEASDFQAAASCFQTAVRLSSGSPFIRFRACRRWTNLLSCNGTPCPRLAYNQAMELLPQLIWIGTTVDRRYQLIADIGDFATEAASYAISINAYDLALQWLEAGRSIVWGHIAQLRTPFDKLSEQNPQLAKELAEIGHRLEHAGSRSSLAASREATDSGNDLGHEINTHAELALKWETLLRTARSVPGFEDFLCIPRASHLLNAAKLHPIAVINLNKSRCDALVIRPDTDTIAHVPLTNFSAENATSVRHQVLCLVRDRKPGPPLCRSASFERSLDTLWSGIVKPVLDCLGYTHMLPINELPHVTWCTTGLLSFLPLHAARSHDPLQPCAFDLASFSYTPTLSALLANQTKCRGEHHGILAIGQAHTPGLSNLPGTKFELAAIKRHAEGAHYMQLEDDEATVESALKAIEKCSWLHMACHGSQGTMDPTKSAFHLHDGDLTLTMITKRSFANKGLAFLSACQTATGDETMPDEAVHLAAGLLMAGYPSVIGTMWSIADEDGPEVAEQVYAELLKDGKFDYTNAAKALHRAVAHLRGKVGEKEIARWAPFIHIGS